MSDKLFGDQETIFNHPEIHKLIKNESPEVRARQNFVPPRCGVFEKRYTVLEPDSRYRFQIDKEAKRQLPHIIDNPVQTIVGTDVVDEEIIKNHTQKRNIGIVFSGGPAPGGHNVIAGLYDAAKKANSDTILYGFLMGPDGIIENEAIEISDSLVNAYRNLGGFTMIKTGRTKIDTPEKVTLSRETCKNLNLDALVIVGGDDSNTNAAFLAQEFHAEGIQVIGVPKTIDGDIQVRDTDGNVICAISFGFHTAARAFANEIGNLCTDSGSDVKYWHICKVMGRVASHLALEVALQTHANMTFIGEDLADYLDRERLAQNELEGEVDYNAYGMTLRHLSRVICDAIVRRAAVGKNYGVMVIPEGILEFINEIQVFIIKLNTIIAEYNKTHDNDFHTEFPALEEKLDYLRRMARRFREEGVFSIWNTRDDDLFNEIPAFFQEGLLIERDAHGNFQFSQVETEKVLLDLVKDYLQILKEKGRYRFGIERAYYQKTLAHKGLDPDYFGPIIFQNYATDRHLIVRESVISKRTLKQELVQAGALEADEDIPVPIEKIYKESIPQFKTQTHFYGYDGRGSDPTPFDCIYAHNLGLTVFSLIANGATGQMAAIKNLEKGFGQWEPIGIPIAPLMHLEERKGRLNLVLEKSLVDLNSTAFKALKALREHWLAAFAGEDAYRRPGPVSFFENAAEDRPLTLQLNGLDWPAAGLD